MQALDLLGVELRALLERREPRLPEDLVDPGAADAGDVALVAQQRVQVARLVEQRGELVERRRRPGLGPEAWRPSRPRRLVGRQQLRPGALLGPELAQPQLAAVRRAGRGPASGGPAARRARRRPAAAPPTSGGRAAPGPPNSTTGILPTRRTPDLGPASASSGGLKLFSATMPGASADSTSAPFRARSIRRAAISTSGSSGTAKLGRYEPCDRRDVHSTGLRVRPSRRPANIRKRKGSMQELPTVQPPLPPDALARRRSRR